MATKGKITKRSVEALPTGTRDCLLWDVEVRGFFAKVTPTGRRSYGLFYRTGSGKQRRPTIGQHGAITADQARQIAKAWLAEVAAGVDPSGARQRNRTAPTVSDLAARYLTEYAEVHKKPSSVRTDRANIENHVLPLLGDKRVAEVSRADIEAAKLSIRQGATARKLKAKKRGRRNVTGGEGIANRVIALLSKMFACSMDWDMRETNPAQGIRKFREFRKDRFLDFDELQRLRTALAAAEGDTSFNPAAVAAIRFLLLTGLRRGEVLELRWGNVDLQRGLLRLSDTKTGARTVPLNTAAFEVLRQVRAGGLSGGGDEGHVFASLRTGKAIALAEPWKRVREIAEIDASATLHTLRHTFASWGVMNGLSLPQVGVLLGHKSTQTTLRYADHVTEAVRGYSERAAHGVSACASGEKPIRVQTDTLKAEGSRNDGQ